MRDPEEIPPVVIPLEPEPEPEPDPEHITAREVLGTVALCVIALGLSYEVTMRIREVFP